MNPFHSSPSPRTYSLSNSPSFSTGKSISFPSLRFRAKMYCSLMLAFLLFGALFLFAIFTDYSGFRSPVSQHFNTSFVDHSPSSSDDRIAMCFCGGLRQFELTAGTIKKYVLSAYRNPDTFIVTPFDAESSKIWILSGSNVVAVDFVKQFDLPSDEIINSVLAEQFKTGRRGLILYAELVERCTHLIKAREHKHGFLYDWILRTRPDSLWNHRAPPLNSLSNATLYIPHANDWYGINDRLTLGSRNLSLKAMSWVSVLPVHYREGKRQMTAEPKFEELLKSFGLIQKVIRSNFSFCILTQHTFGYPLDWFGDVRTAAPVSPLNASGSGDGRYCRPCVPQSNLPITPDFGLQKFHTDLFCDSSDPQFKVNWEEEFDDMFGDGIANLRRLFKLNDNFWSCVQYLQEFLLKVEVVVGEKDPFVICSRRYSSQ